MKARHRCSGSVRGEWRYPTSGGWQAGQKGAESAVDLGRLRPDRAQEGSVADLDPVNPGKRCPDQVGRLVLDGHREPGQKVLEKDEARIPGCGVVALLPDHREVCGSRLRYRASHAGKRSLLCKEPVPIYGLEVADPLSKFQSS